MKIYFLSLLFLTSCAAVKTDLPNLAQVNANIYRGGQPTLKGLKLLQSKGIRTIIDLNDNEPELKQEILDTTNLGLSLISIPESGLLAPHASDISRIEADLNDSSLYPIYIHCEHGKDRTGLAVALYRVQTEGWAPKKAHDEMMALGHSKLLFLMDDYFWDHVK